MDWDGWMQEIRMIGDDVGKQVQASMKNKVVVLGDTISMLVQRSL